MMPQQESDDSRHATYGAYEGDQSYTHPYAETSSGRLFKEEIGGKISPQPHDSKNLFRFAIAALSMGTLIALVIVCLLFIGGTGGWIGFIVASCVIFGIAIAALTSTNNTR